jgi:hypothetical protein
VDTGKHCAILFDKHYKMIHYFVNRYRTDGVLGSVHAEEGLIKHITKGTPHFDFSDTTLVVVRGNLIGEYSNSCPCDNCLCLLRKTKVKNIIFTSRDNILRLVR